MEWLRGLDLNQRPLGYEGKSSPQTNREEPRRTMAWESPRDRFVKIPRAVHTLHEDNPEAVLDALREFLGS